MTCESYLSGEYRFWLQVSQNSAVYKDMNVWVSENFCIMNFYETTFLLLVKPNIYIHIQTTNSSKYITCDYKITIRKASIY